MFPSESCRRKLRVPCSTPTAPVAKRAACLPAVNASPPASTPTRPHGRIFNKAIEEPKRVAPASHASHHRIRKLSGGGEDLPPRLLADHRLKFAYHQRIRVRAQHRAEKIVRAIDVRYPVPHRLVDRVLERSAAGVDALDRRAEEPHAYNVRSLAAHVLGAHVDIACEPQERADRGGRDAVLPRAGLRHDPALAHPPGQQSLPQRVVDLVGPGVGKILAFQEEARAARLGGEPPRFVEGRFPPRVVSQKPGQFSGEGRIGPGLQVGALQLLHRLDQRFRHEASAVRAEVAAGIRVAPPERRGRHRPSPGGGVSSFESASADTA